jgi:hypothetical protein
MSEPEELQVARSELTRCKRELLRLRQSSSPEPEEVFEGEGGRCRGGVGHC